MNKFQEDLKIMSLEDALIKNNLSLKEAIQKITQTKELPRKTNNPSQYIHQRNDTYTVKKYNKRRHKTLIYGTYNSLEDAIKLRDYMVAEGWNHRKVDEYCEILGIERRKKGCKKRYR